MQFPQFSPDARAFPIRSQHEKARIDASRESSPNASPLQSNSITIPSLAHSPIS